MTATVQVWLLCWRYGYYGGGMVTMWRYDCHCAGMVTMVEV